MENEIMEVGNVGMVRAPEAVLAEAHKAAVALQGVLRGKKNPVVFNKEQYIESDDWQLLGRFYGLTAKVVSTTPVDYGGVKGFEARAVVVDIRNGIEVSAAEAMCLNDEDKWSIRAKYEWWEMSLSRCSSSALWRRRGRARRLYGTSWRGSLSWQDTSQRWRRK